MICGAAFATFAVAAPAFAQDSEVDAVFVTGSRIPQPNLVTTSPVTQVTADDITNTGVNRVEDLVNQLPQAFAAQNSSVSNGASGTATVDLRALGSVRTLVLVDGRRLPYGSPNDPAADLNQIPSALVERVEVLTGGASAVYGSDAIAGVVNFIMKKDFEGVQLSGQYSFYQHNNDFNGVGKVREEVTRRALTNPSQFQLPDDNVIDGYGKEVSLLMGVSAPDDRGNITAYVTYRNNDSILQAARDYSACSIANPAAVRPNQFTCGGSSTSYPGRFTDFATFDYSIDAATGNTFRAWNAGTDQYNYGPVNYYQRPDERYSLGAVGRYEVNDKVEVFTQLMFTDYSTVAQIAPSGDFFSTGTINCGNPLLSAQQSAAIGCSAADIAADNTTDLYIGRRNVEGGGRQDDLRYQSYRGVIGARGQLNDAWSYDVAGQYSRVQLSRTYQNDFSVTRLNRALDVVSVGGVPTCRSVVNGTDPNCVPWDIFTIGNVDSAALDYLQVPGIQRAATIQQVVTASVAGDLTGYGLKTPWSTSGFQVAFGAEYRRDALESTTDNAFATGDLAGQGGPTIGLAGVTEVYDLFFEGRMPLVEDMPGAKLLSLEVAYRFSDYGSGQNTDTYKIGGDWAPTDDLRIRASYQQAVRAPNVIELFQAQGLGLFDIDEDPCGPAKTATLAQCQATGVTAAQYGSAALDSPAGQYNFFGGGNPNLAPETAKTYTLGVVFTPSFVPGLNVSVDYFNIEVQDLVSTVGADNTLNACYNDNLASACARIHRNALGNFWTNGGFIDDFNVNIGGLKTSGYDFVANYGFGIGEMGDISLNFVGTLLDELVTDPGEGIAPFDCVGKFALRCGTPKPEWRHRARVGWTTPWNVDVAMTWRYIGEVEIDGGAGTRIDGKFDAENYFDLYASWKATDTAKFRIGVNNVLDNDPQLSTSVGTTGNGNTYPQTYDSFGRYVFMGFTLDF
ncbi:MAG: TonB-dependent receptor [Caulobacter sp.]|nr:TonB-dependent receptor [Caulobacter sp.]